MGKSAHRDLIISGIKKNIIPYFESLGFSLEPSRNVKVFGESKSLYPLGCLIRYSEDETMDIIEFKLGKYKNTGFEINFAQIPRYGAYHNHGFSPQSETAAYGFGNFGTYQKSRFFSFSNFCSYLFNFNSKRNVKRGVSKALRHAFEVEDWFQTRKVGKRLRTHETLEQGVTIYRGWPKFFFLRSVNAGYMTPLNSERMFFSRSEVQKYSSKELFKQNRKIKFGTYWPWQTIRH